MMRIFLLAAMAALWGVTPVFAADIATQISLCAAALDSKGMVEIDDYRVKFVKSKGGAVQTVTLKLVPIEQGDSLQAECVIKRGEVLSAAIKV